VGWKRIKLRNFSATPENTTQKLFRKFLHADEEEWRSEAGE
jgi:hypothetical protein